MVGPNFLAEMSEWTGGAILTVAKKREKLKTLALCSTRSQYSV